MTETSAYSPICMVYSKMTLKDIEDLFTSVGGGDRNYGTMRIVRVKDPKGTWQDTNRTIVLISEVLYDQLIKMGYDKPVRSPDRPNLDFRIVPYGVRESNLPKEGLKKDLFIRIPKESNFTADDVRKTILDKLQPLVKLNIMAVDDYRVNIPLRNMNRETGLVTGSCFLSFSPSVTSTQAAQVKAVIDDTYWPDGQTFNCYWARDNNMSAAAENGTPAQPKKLWVKKNTQE